MGAASPTEILRGNYLRPRNADPNEEGSGFLHWVRIDLTAAGIELYVTPLRSLVPLAQGWQYRLRRIEDVDEPRTPRGRDQRHPVHVEFRLVAADVRGPRQQRGNRGGRPRRQSRLGAHVFAVVRRPVDAAIAALEAANGGRTWLGRNGASVDKAVVVVGWQSLAR